MMSWKLWGNQAGDRLLCPAMQTCNPLNADAATSVSGEQSQKYREELEQLIKSRMAPGERALPELKSSPTVCA